MAVHGDITEITYNHEDLGQGVFYPKAGESNTFDKGGVRNSDEASGLAGNGEMIVTKNRVRGFFEIVTENQVIGSTDATGIVGEIMASPKSAEWTISLINGQVWACNGIPVGDIQVDTNTGVFTLKVATGIWKKIVG